MREITDHKLNGLNDAIRIKVLDEPGAGGACHHYLVHVPMRNPVEQYPEENSRLARAHCEISFQKGPIQEAGINGISGEALIAVNIDRLRSFQAGPFASDDNAHALDHLQKALHFLQKRTRERMARGVEGTSQK